MQIYTKPELASIIKEATPKPKFELTQSQINRLKSASDIVLAIAGIAGLTMVSVLAPNALQMFKSAFVKDDSPRMSFKDRQKKLGRSFYYLKDKNYIQLKPKGRDLEIHLTDKGRKKLKSLKLDTLEIKKPLFWDGKFWQVAADIPIQYRNGADALRKKLRQIGFYSLQRTLWFYPYDPRKEVELLIKEYEIDRFVTVMKIALMDYADQKVLKDFFKETKVIEF